MPEKIDRNLEHVEQLYQAMDKFKAVWMQYKKAKDDVTTAVKSAQVRTAEEKRKDAARLQLIERAAEQGEFLPSGDRNPAFEEKEKLEHKIYQWDYIENASFDAALKVMKVLFPDVDAAQKNARAMRDKVIAEAKAYTEQANVFNYDFEVRQIDSAERQKRSE